MIKGYPTFICACLLAISFGLSTAQPMKPTRQDKREQALNKYVDFTNECIHILWAVHERLESFNADANFYVKSRGQAPLKFRIDDVVRNYSYFGVLKGVCAKGYGVTDPEVNIQQLYEETARENGYIPEAARISLNSHREEMMYTMIKILSLCDTLKLKTETAVSAKDPILNGVYQTMKDIQYHYDSFEVVRKLLEKEIKTVSRTIPEVVNDLMLIMVHTQEILQDLRNENTRLLGNRIIALESAITAAEIGMLENQDELKRLHLYYDRENMGYKHMIEYAKQIVRRSQSYLIREAYSPAYQQYGKEYYYYNERLLALYNHHRYGIVAYFNRFIGFSNISLPKKIEETPWFLVIDPEVPTDPDLEPMATQEAEVIVSEFMDQDPPGLVGAAANNWVFLLDVSASMKKPEKLTLLKESITYLLEYMRPEDHLAIVTYSGEAKVVLNSTSAANQTMILTAINGLSSGGGTNLRKGIRQAYNIAEKAFISNGNNRIILATDGAFEIAASTTRMVEQKSEENILLSVLLFSRAEPTRTAQQLSFLANAGGGNYFHVKPDNANKILLQEARAIRK